MSTVAGTATHVFVHSWIVFSEIENDTVFMPLPFVNNGGGVVVD